jgi:hypothetical protein
MNKAYGITMPSVSHLSLFGNGSITHCRMTIQELLDIRNGAHSGNNWKVKLNYSVNHKDHVM